MLAERENLKIDLGQARPGYPELLSRAIREIDDSSLFHQVAAAPAEPVRWATDGLIVGVALLAAVLGALGFARRDLAGA